MKRDFFNADPRELLEQCLESLYLDELHRTGECKDLGISMLALIPLGAAMYPDIDRAIAENSYLCDLIHAEVDKMDWNLNAEVE